jgi:large subunit ribosomal protein L46
MVKNIAYPRRITLHANALATLAEKPSSYRIVAATILNRAPLLTPTPHPFEQAYYEYQAKLARAISSPLPTDVYFKPGSLLERRFALEERQREKEAFGEDFTPLISLPVEDTGKGGGKSLADQLAEEASLEEKPQPRTHKDDLEKNIKSLNRAGERNLYLLVKKNRKTNSWQFPQGGVEKAEALHKVRTHPLT